MTMRATLKNITNITFVRSKTKLKNKIEKTQMNKIKTILFSSKPILPTMNNYYNNDNNTTNKNTTKKHTYNSTTTTTTKHTPPD